MLELTIPEEEGWDEIREEFVVLPAITLRLEHSLLSLSKWEAIWGKHFLGRNDLTQEEIISYIECMSDEPIPPGALSRLRSEDGERVAAYLKADATATRITDRRPVKRSSAFVTSEVIYGWMTALRIPFHPAETWHLNRLLTFIRVCQIQQDPKPSKMNQNDWIAERNRLNAQRQAERAKRLGKN